MVVSLEYLSHSQAIDSASLAPRAGRLSDSWAFWLCCPAHARVAETSTSRRGTVLQCSTICCLQYVLFTCS